MLSDDYRVYWRPQDFCGLRHADIFSGSGREVEQIPDDSPRFDSWRFVLPAELRELLPAGFSDCSSGYKGVRFPGDGDSKVVDCEYLRIPAPILEALKRAFAKIEFRREILDIVAGIRRGMPERYVGVHARTWVEDAERRSKWFNFGEFVDACSKFKGVEIFVASDDPEFARQLSGALNKNLITISKPAAAPKAWPLNTPQEMIRDIVELLVLARASRLVLTPMSTYSEVAWYLGGCSAEVYFADPGFSGRSLPVHRPAGEAVDNLAGKADDTHWIRVAGNPGYVLALVRGHHVHLDTLGEGVHKIGDYFERYGGYMRGTASSDYMIDVGANIGLAAFPVAAAGRRVVAFEPVAENLAAMRRTMERNDFGNVTLIPRAVSAEVGYAHVFIPAGRADNTSLGREAANANVRRSAIRQDFVATETIDHWFEANGEVFAPRDCRLLKIDVQGYETLVLKGAGKFIEACRPFEKLLIELEFDPKLISMAGYSTYALLELIHSYGMDVYHDGNLIPSGNYQNFCATSGNCDLLASFRPAPR